MILGSTPSLLQHKLSYQLHLSSGSDSSGGRSCILPAVPRSQKRHKSKSTPVKPLACNWMILKISSWLTTWLCTWLSPPVATILELGWRSKTSAFSWQSLHIWCFPSLQSWKGLMRNSVQLQSWSSSTISLRWCWDFRQADQILFAATVSLRSSSLGSKGGSSVLSSQSFKRQRSHSLWSQFYSGIRCIIRPEN